MTLEGFTYQSRRVGLRPISIADHEPLRLLELSTNVAPTWRFGGRHPSPEEYPGVLWREVFAQYLAFSRAEMATDSESGAPLALHCAYGHDAVNGTLNFASARFREGVMASALFVESAVLLIDKLFSITPVRKLYLESAESSYERYSSIALADAVVEEGCLRQHRFVNGTFQDVYVLAIYRDAWEQLRPALDWLEP